MKLQRVLIANRGEIAMRLIHMFRARGVETVSVFSELEAEAPWVEEADYAVYLNGRSVSETYTNVERVIAAALDSACDAIHPGYCFLAERLDFQQAAAAANIPVIGTDLPVLERIVDRFRLRAAAHEVGIPLIPASTVLDEDDDGISEAARLGFPVFVKALAGGVLRRVEGFDKLADAIGFVRETAGLVTGNRSVYLEREVPVIRHIGVNIVADRHGVIARLGRSDGSLQVAYRSWVEEMGAGVPGNEIDDKIGRASLELAQKVGWVGVGRIRYALTAHGGWHLLGMSARLTTGFDLAEAIHGVDLVDTQLRVLLGEPLGWQHADFEQQNHAFQLRVFHVDPSDGRSRPRGTLERLVVPENPNVTASVGVGEGQLCTPDTEPLLVKLTVVAPTRQAALVKARKALQDLVIEGVVNNRETLLRVLGDERVWRGDHDVGTVERLLQRGRNGGGAPLTTVDAAAENN